MQGTKTFILNEVKKRRFITAAQVVHDLHLSRQTATQHLRELVALGKLVKTGSTKASKYYLPSSIQSRTKTPVVDFQAIRRRKDLQEDQVFEELNLKLRLSKQLSKPAFEIVQYAFTEMLNNAIEHSKSRRVAVYAHLRHGSFEFTIRDFGVGVFESIKKKFRFHNHLDAVQHLLKGKQTTAPEKHAGEGIFFTSKIADFFRLKSAKMELSIDHQREDQFLAENRHGIAGTEVMFSIKIRTRRGLKSLFDAYTNDKYEFDRTAVSIRLAQRDQKNYVSRSEARRLIFGLDKFKRIDLNFRDVHGIGQGFADEIFRVFAKAHPKIIVRALHTTPAVDFMIRRAKANLTIEASDTLQLGHKGKN